MATRKPNSRQVWPKVKTRPLSRHDSGYLLPLTWLLFLYIIQILLFVCMRSNSSVSTQPRREPPTLSFCTAVDGVFFLVYLVHFRFNTPHWLTVGRLVAWLKLVVDSRRGRLLYPRYLPVKLFSLSTNLPRECLVWSGHESCGVWTRKGRPLHC